MNNNIIDKPPGAEVDSSKSTADKGTKSESSTTGANEFGPAAAEATKFDTASQCYLTSCI